MVEAVSVVTVTQLAGGVMGNIPLLGDLPQRPLLQLKPGRPNVMSVNHETMSTIPQRSETEVVIVLIHLGALNFHAVERREKGGKVYNPFVAGEGGCGIVWQRQFTGTFSEEVHSVVGNNPNMGGNPQKFNAEGVFLSCNYLLQYLVDD